MEWSDTGLVLGIRKHGESSVILEAMTRGHGRHLGLVRGGRSRTRQPVLQVGNTLELVWRARLEEHLGIYTAEAGALRAADVMATRSALGIVQTLASHLRLLPERDPHPELYDAAHVLLDNLEDPLVAGALLVRFELRLLEELGFGLDLSRCASTGDNDGLAYVSPKTGRAVSASAGEPWHDRLLRLPPFIAPGGKTSLTEGRDVADGLAMTGHFLARDIYDARGIEPPLARDSLRVELAR
ncbi:MAG: DNA repair protein RecO [Pseudomonadota bacterium]